MAVTEVNTQRRVWSGLRQIQTLPSELGVLLKRNKLGTVARQLD
jgi:hypothetical protein